MLLSLNASVTDMEVSDFCLFKLLGHLLLLMTFLINLVRSSVFVALRYKVKTCLPIKIIVAIMISQIVFLFHVMCFWVYHSHLNALAFFCLQNRD